MIKKLWAKVLQIENYLKKVTEPFNLKSKFPNYFNLTIIRFGWFLLLCLVVTDIYLNDWELGRYVVSCPENALYPCKNYYFECPTSNRLNLYPVELIRNIDCRPYVEPKYCPKNSCREPVIYQGLTYDSRDDILAKYPFGVVFVLLVVIFGANHLVWMVKK